MWQGKWLKAYVLYSKAGVAQQIWIANEKGAVLVDAGDGIVRDILSSEFDVKELMGVIFTHGHYDHIGDIHSLLGYLRCVGKKGSLQIYAPEGCMEALNMVNNFISCYPDTIPFKISYKEVKEDQFFEISGMTFKAYPVVHHGSIKDYGILDQIPALAYRVSYREEIIAISGDTGVCLSLEALVRGADLAILEATFEGSNQIKEESLKKEHLSEDVAKEIGKLAKDFILIHKGRREGKRF